MYPHTHFPGPSNAAAGLRREGFVIARLRKGFTIVELLIVMGIIGVLASLLAPAYVSARREARTVDCKNNLRQLGTVLASYLTRYGDNRSFPITLMQPGQGSGAPIPGTPNGDFWAYLYRIPAQTDAVVQRPGEDGLFACKVLGSALSSTIVDYTGPRFGSNFPAALGTGAIYPGNPSRLSDAVRPDVFIGGDIIFGAGANFNCNHGGPSGAPTNSTNTLAFDGHCDAIEPGSNQFLLYTVSTTGLRST
ncbi:MAG: type II secretion system protein [Planctomycetes bacterium]|nr:type II secretion system protein [Planctomycetota bacterium]